MIRTLKFRLPTTVICALLLSTGTVHANANDVTARSSAERTVTGPNANANCLGRVVSIAAQQGGMPELVVEGRALAESALATFAELISTGARVRVENADDCVAATVAQLLK